MFLRQPQLTRDPSTDNQTSDLSPFLLYIGTAELLKLVVEEIEEEAAKGTHYAEDCRKSIICEHFQLRKACQVICV